MKEEIAIESVKNQILDSAIDVFCKYGYSKVSMDDIAKAWGKSRTTLYYYYKNKLEIFEALALKGYNDVITYAAAGTSAEQNIETNLQEYMHRRFAKMLALVRDNEHIIQDVKDNIEVAKRLYTSLMEDEIRNIRNIIKWALHKNEIGSLHKDEIDLLSHVLVTTMRSYEEELVLFKHVQEINSKIDWLLRIVCKGLK